MHKIKLYHEAPTSLIEIVDRHTDGGYALVHLLDSNNDYYEKFKKLVEAGREVILDNSIFELGVSFDPDKYLYWIRKLKPTHYIIPDVLENCGGTLDQLENWEEYYRKSADLVSSPIGVLQGKNLMDFVSVLARYLEAGINYIAISFDYSYYLDTFPHPNPLVSYALGRVKLIGDLTLGEWVSEYPDLKIHLLGCALPIEFHFYTQGTYPIIHSIDTSNPVVAGIQEVAYKPLRRLTKSQTKLYTVIDKDSSEIPVQRILQNIELFRNLVNPTNL
jgi:hypothetical protein